MQGLVDGHTHACQQLLRGRVSDEYPMVWTRFLVPFESNLRPDDSYISGQLACLEMIKNGTTSFADSGGVHMERVADAVDVYKRQYLYDVHLHIRRCCFSSRPLPISFYWLFIKK